MLYKNNYNNLDNEQLIALYKDGEKDVKDYFYEKNKGLIYGIIKRYQNNTNKDDLYQIGCIGFMKAFNQFDLSYHVKFSTYAIPVILGEIKKYFRDEGNIHIARSLKENYYKIMNCKEVLSQHLLREPTLEEISVALNINLEDIVLSLEANTYVSSFDEVIYESDGNDITLLDVSSNKVLVDHILKIAISEECALLNEKEKQLIYYRYYQNYKQKEISKILNLSQVQVSRLEKKALLKLRERFQQVVL